MFTLRIEHAGHVRNYSIEPVGASGWEARVQEDRRTCRTARYRDWHRVERAIAAFEREVSHLTSCGWRILTRDPGA